MIYEILLVLFAILGYYRLEYAAPVALGFYLVTTRMRYTPVYHNRGIAVSVFLAVYVFSGFFDGTGHIDILATISISIMTWVCLSTTCPGKKTATYEDKFSILLYFLLFGVSCIFLKLDSIILVIIMLYGLGRIKLAKAALLLLFYLQLPVITETILHIPASVYLKPFLLLGYIYYKVFSRQINLNLDFNLFFNILFLIAYIFISIIDFNSGLLLTVIILKNIEAKGQIWKLFR